MYQERNMHRSVYVKTVQNRSKQICCCMDYDVKGQQKMDFYTGESVFMDYGHEIFIRSLRFVFYELFELWRHPFTAEDPLENKLCNATFFQICSDEETNSFCHAGYTGGARNTGTRNDELLLEHFICNTEQRSRDTGTHTNDVKTRQRHWEHWGLIKGRKRRSKQDNYWHRAGD